MTINFRYWKTRYVRYSLLAITFFIALIATGLLCGLEKNDWAAWAQAFGAIVGIAIAIAIPALQRQTERREQALAIKDAEASQAQKIADLADELLDFIVSAKGFANANYVNVQQHLPELLSRIAELRAAAVRPALNAILKKINKQAWLIQNYGFQIAILGHGFTEQMVSYQRFEQAMLVISLEANVLRISLRDAAAEAQA
ncbi:hypothetical protein MRBLMS1_002867 [Massilia sp. LMS1-1-1.1]